MALWKPDATFYPSARMAMQAPPERLGYVVTFNPDARRVQPDALCVMDLNPSSPSYGTVIGRTEMPGLGDELHHFGWNACSAALCPYAPHPHIERRYLLVVPTKKLKFNELWSDQGVRRSPSTKGSSRAGAARKDWI